MTETTNSTKRRLILASASPRRRELLAGLGYSFDVIPSGVDEPESLPNGMRPTEFAEWLSMLKAQDVARQSSDAIVIGADTIVALDGKLYGKAADADDARTILHNLMHNHHDVITGITIMDSASGRFERAHATTKVVMRPMPDAVLEEYLAGDLWHGKAGAYGIQDHGDDFVERIEGSFSNVVGLPVELLTAMLDRWGLQRSIHR